MYMVYNMGDKPVQALMDGRVIVVPAKDNEVVGSVALPPRVAKALVERYPDKLTLSLTDAQGMLVDDGKRSMMVKESVLEELGACSRNDVVGLIRVLCRAKKCEPWGEVALRKVSTEGLHLLATALCRGNDPTTLELPESLVQ